MLDSWRNYFFKKLVWGREEEEDKVCFSFSVACYPLVLLSGLYISVFSCHP